MTTSQYQGVYEVVDLATRMVERHKDDAGVEPLCEEIAAVVAAFERTIHKLTPPPKNIGWLREVFHRSSIDLALLPNRAKTVVTNPNSLMAGGQRKPPHAGSPVV